MTTRLSARAKPALDEDPNAWRRRGLCRRYPEQFFGSTAAEVATAKWVCGRCPVLATCRSWVLDPDTKVVEHGVVGGLSTKERQRIRSGRVEAPAVQRTRRAPERPGTRALTPEQVDAIRRDPRSSYAISGEYGIGATTVQRIRRQRAGVAA
jgi:WhiB family redox-sensing transcriptional regulator